MYFEEVELEKIDFKDKKYRTLNQNVSDKLKRSIEDFGLINPVKLIRHKNGYKVLTGWERLAALKDLKIKKVAANIYNVNELTPEAIYKLIYLDNKHRSDDLLKAELISRIKSESGLSEKDLVNDILSFFNLNPSINNLNKYIAISELNPVLKLSFLEDKLSFEQLHMLSELKNSEDRMEIFRSFLSGFKFNNNESRDLIKDLLIIKQREKISIKKIAKTVFDNIKDDANKNELRKEIKKICYPKLTKVESLYQKRLSELKLSDNIRFVNHPYFESNDLEVRIKFRGSDELTKALQNLENKLRAGMIDKLVGVIKEGK